MGGAQRGTHHPNRAAAGGINRCLTSSPCSGVLPGGRSGGRVGSTAALSVPSLALLGSAISHRGDPPSPHWLCDRPRGMPAPPHPPIQEAPVAYVEDNIALPPRSITFTYYTQENLTRSTGSWLT